MPAPSHRKAPNFPIAPILEHLGFENVPRVTGTTRRQVRCILHGEDRRPSAGVSQYGFHCFTCGRSGDAIKMLREEEGLTFEAALELCEELTRGTNSGGATEREFGRSLLE